MLWTESPQCRGCYRMAENGHRAWIGAQGRSDWWMIVYRGHERFEGWATSEAAAREWVEKLIATNRGETK